MRLLPPLAAVARRSSRPPRATAAAVPRPAGCAARAPSEAVAAATPRSGKTNARLSRAPHGRYCVIVTLYKVAVVRRAREPRVVSHRRVDGHSLYGGVKAPTPYALPTVILSMTGLEDEALARRRQRCRDRRGSASARLGEGTYACLLVSSCVSCAPLLPSPLLSSRTLELDTKRFISTAALRRALE